MRIAEQKLARALLADPQALAALPAEIRGVADIAAARTAELREAQDELNGRGERRAMTAHEYERGK